MPQLIPLQSLPNQSFPIILENHRYVLTFRLCIEIMAVDIERDGELVIQGERCVAGGLLIPYQYMENALGNFMFTVENDDLPHYSQFGVTQFLWYYTNAEMEEYRASVG